MKNNKKQKKKRSLAGKFFLIVFSIIFVYCIAFGAYIAYTYLNGNPDDNYFSQAVGEAVKSIVKVPDRTNVLLLGVDADETRTDTIMLASFDSVNKKVSLISIPRDTLVVVPEERWSIMCDNVPQLNRYGTRETKINAIHAYGGDDYGVDFLELQLEEMLGVDIDYYAKVNCEAFRKIVDAIGGIEYDVPMRMYYNDPTPGKELYIDLQPGLQTLNGEQAEQLVRYRKGYDRQDLDRIETQQSFMKVLISTILSKENIMSNPKTYLDVIFNDVETDMRIDEAVKYVPYVSDITVEGYTLPGIDQYINGGSYYIYDEDSIDDMIDSIYNASSEENADDESEDSLDKDICILNGGYTSGLAGEKQRMLEDKGYNVTEIGDYDGTKKENTRIYVNSDGMGRDLAELFTDAEIIVNSEKTDSHDIVIVLGTDEE